MQCLAGAHVDHGPASNAIYSTSLDDSIRGAFGLLMARLLERDIEVMSSTAAYAAVLVVFVCLNTSGSS